jgi:hypothetical protein
MQIGCITPGAPPDRAVASRAQCRIAHRRTTAREVVRVMQIGCITRPMAHRAAVLHYALALALALHRASHIRRIACRRITRPVAHRAAASRAHRIARLCRSAPPHHAATASRACAAARRRITRPPHRAPVPQRASHIRRIACRRITRPVAPRRRITRPVAHRAAASRARMAHRVPPHRPPVPYRAPETIPFASPTICSPFASSGRVVSRARRRRGPSWAPLRRARPVA